MSNARYSIISARAVFDQRLSSSEVRVLNALGTYADGEGWCFPNQTTLAERLGLSRQFVCGAIKRLVSCGYVETAARTAQGRGRVGLTYRVRLDLPREEAEAKALKEAVVASDGQRGGCQAEPKSADDDNGAVVATERQPMSSSDELGIDNALTTPTERPQQSFGSNEPQDIVGGEGLGETAYERAAKAKKAAKAAKKPGKAKRAPAKRVTTYPPEFAAIWLSWPKHRRENSDKQTAFKRWQTGCETWGAEAIEAAAKHYLAAPDTRKDGFRYCCLVEVFMNGKLESAVEAALLAKTEPVRKVWSPEAGAFVEERAQ